MVHATQCLPLRHRNFVASADSGVRLQPSTSAHHRSRAVFRCRERTLRGQTPVTHQIGIIGGDGIGPEVVAEAMKCVDATGVAYEAVPFDLGGARYLRDGVVLPEQEHLDDIRRLDAVMLGAVGTPEVPPGRDRARAAAHAALRARPLREPAPVRRRPEPLQRRRRHDRRPREHRGHLRGRGRVPAQGHAARGRHAGFGEHAHGRRAVRALRVRARAGARAQAPHARAQDQRAHLRRRPLAAHLRRRRRRVPRRRHRATTTSTPRASTSCRTRVATT